MERQTSENTFKNITLTIYNCVYSTGILISPVCLKLNYGNSLKLYYSLMVFLWFLMVFQILIHVLFSIMIMA